MKLTSRILVARFYATAIEAICCIAVAGNAWAAKGGPIVPELRLTPSQARCLADNAELLLRDEGDPVVFYFDLCLADETARGSSRQSLPDVPKPKARPSGLAKDPAGAPIKVSKMLLRCLQMKKVQNPAFLETNPVVLKPSACPHE